MPPYPPIPPTARDELPPAGPGSLASAGLRALALILDNLLIWLVLYTVWLHSYIVTTGNKTVIKDLPTSIIVVLWALPVIYSAVCIMLKGTTIGGGLLGLKVVRYVDGGSVAPYQAVIRALLPALPSIVAGALPSALGTVFSLLQLLVYMSIFFDRMLRGLHDKAAGTIVLRTR